MTGPRKVISMPLPRFWRVLLVCVLAGAGVVQARAQVSMGTVVDLAQRNSSAVRLAEADMRKAQAVLAESKDVFVPSLTFSTGLPVFPEVGFTGTPPSIWSATVQSLAFSLSQKRYIDAAHSGVQAAMAALKEARERAALDVSTAYIELDSVNQELAAAAQQQDFGNRLVSIEQQRSEAGVDSVSEMLQARLTAANLKLARIHLETRAASLSKQLSVLTGLPVGSITPDHGSIPEIPQLHGDSPRQTLPGIDSARYQAKSKLTVARGDQELSYMPQLSFGAQYNRNTTLLNSVNQFFAHPLPANNFSSGIAVTIPIFDRSRYSKAHESNADALRARIEAEQAERQNDVQIEELNSSLRELDAQAEVAGLKQQIAGEQLKAVLQEVETGNGNTASGAPQLSPKAEQLSRIDERQKAIDAEEASLELAKARLNMLRALGHMEDWLKEVHAGH